MNTNAALIISVLPEIVKMVRNKDSDNKIITKVVRIAERVVVGDKKGQDRLAFALAVLRGIRPALLATADLLDKVKRKISIVVTLLKDRDIDKEGWDDELAEKLEGVVVFVDGLGSWFAKTANRLSIDEIEEIAGGE